MLLSFLLIFLCRGSNPLNNEYIPVRGKNFKNYQDACRHFGVDFNLKFTRFGTWSKRNSYLIAAQDMIPPVVKEIWYDYIDDTKTIPLINLYFDLTPEDKTVKNVDVLICKGIGRWLTGRTPGLFTYYISKGNTQAVSYNNVVTLQLSINTTFIAKKTKMLAIQDANVKFHPHPRYTNLKSIHAVNKIK